MFAAIPVTRTVVGSSDGACVVGRDGSLEEGDSTLLDVSKDAGGLTKVLEGKRLGKLL